MSDTSQVSTLIAEIRRQIGDEHSPYRWDDDDMYDYFTAAARVVVDRHPEAAYVSAITWSDPTAIASPTQYLQTAKAYDPAYIHYVAHRLLAEDKEDAANVAASKTHYDLFIAEMR